MSKRQSKRQSHEQGAKLARQSLETHFKRRAGEAIVAATIPELIRSVPCSSGISSENMFGALQRLKQNQIVKVKTQRPNGPTRIKLTPAGRESLGIGRL